MRILRYLDSQGEPRYGWALDDQVGPIEGNIFSDFRRMEAENELSQVKLIAPVSPSKIICVGRNFAAHAREHDAEVPEVPMLFLKPPSAIIGPGDTILLPPQSQRIEHEVELCVVIGRRGRWIPPAEAYDYVLGYTVANDVTARDLQFRDGQWTRGKAFDTFLPLGPWIETDFDPSDRMITSHVNEELRQMASTRDMIFSVRQLIAFASSVMTLEPGDLLLTGTPAGVGPLLPGDVVEVSVEGIGSLRNRAESEPAR